jgi:hypothetical protein
MAIYRRRIFLGWAGLSLLAIALPGLAQELSFDADRESIGKIKLGMSLSQVRQILGRPRRQDPTTINNCTGEYDGNWHYNGLDIHFSSPDAAGKTGRVFAIKATRSGYRTTRRIGVGDRAAKVKKAYGGLDLVDDQSASYLNFVVDSGDRVTEIQLLSAIC